MPCCRNNLPALSTCRWNPVASSARSSSSKGLLDHRSLTRALATQLGLPTVDLRTVQPSADAMAYVKEEMARRLRIVPMRLVDGVLDVAISDNSTEVVQEALSRLDVRHVNIYLAPADDVMTSLNTYYRVLSETDDSVKQFWDSAAAKQSQIEAVISATDEAPIIQLVNKIVTQALRDRASDIHIEPTDGRDPNPLPRRRRAPRGAQPSRGNRARAGQPHQDHGRHGHRRTAPSAGRPVRDDRSTAQASTSASPPARRSGARPPCCDCSTRVAR